MKKFGALALVLCLSFALFTACGSTSSSSSSSTEPSAQRTTFRIAGLKGPTTLGMLKMMGDVQDGTARHDYEVSVYGTADEIVPLIAKGEIDAAMVPANLASVLYNSTKGQVQVAAINTLGVLYMVETGDTVKTVADLKGKTIYTTGKGTTPEYVLNYVLKQNGLDPEKDVDIQYKSESTEVAAELAKTDKDVIAMLPEPYVTTVKAKNENLRTALDMTQEWNKVSDKGALVTGVLVVRTEFAEQNKAAFNELLEDYAASIQFVNNDPAAAAALSEKFNIFPAAVAEKAIPNCNIVYFDGDEMKEKLSGYLQVLYDQNPKSVGGALPDDSFYYQK